MSFSIYFKKLSKEEKIATLKAMILKEETPDVKTLTTSCSKIQPISPPPNAPNGEYVCSGGSWVWVPEIG